jgi:hypothetical protein
VWHNGHTIYGAPMQRAAGVHVAFAVISVAFVIGGTTTPILGWAFALLVPVVAWVVHAARADRRRVRPLADRRTLAEARGWRYKNSDAALATRWRKRDRARAPYASLPFGIVAGTVNQLPFTAFDTEGDSGRHTNWAVHLPVSFPRIVVWGPAPPPGPSSFDGLADQFFGGAQGGAAMRDMFAQMAQRPEVDADDPEFAAALATPEIRQATAALDLRGWLIDGRDMILSRNYSPTAPCPATELAAVADRLASLFYRFPLDAAQRWGSTPTTDVPLADAAR